MAHVGTKTFAAPGGHHIIAVSSPLEIASLHEDLKTIDDLINTGINIDAQGVRDGLHCMLCFKIKISAQIT